MPDLSSDSVRNLLADFKDPETGRSVTQLEQLHDVQAADGKVAVKLGLTSWAAILRDEVTQHCRDFLAERLPAGTDIQVEAVEHDRPAEPIGQIGLRAKNVIAVGSGKGGVGKSTVSTSIALALSKAGSKVGLMDADVYGPSVPHLLGTDDRPTAIDKRLQPVEKDGLRVMSMGFLVPKEEAVVWRGPMLHGAITQFLKDTDWGDLDYLVIDMPPGTGDIALTLSQLLPLTGAVVVCTPQEVALLDAVKAIAMFRKVKIPLLGIVENMSYFLCPDNNKRYDIFGTGGARAKAEELSVPFLGELPINIGIRQRGDDGQTAGNLTDQETAQGFEQIARQMVRNIARQHEQAPAMPSLPVL
ncbi:Flagellum site-determining protein YlxH [Posidoniimonas polymericola]|uniref:Iron-sulfur cluster carrier protein n=1 Tax=Posidoniimonas polymericola TaxID=2528002 RepID=A0A5C5YS06_9BACT|nr:Mrp/NBP35 family ATP-binding protein [Posidoniimonas polymericola]TWT77732.1 Flagellum site-determining protein YlxH [Posidoniimonas polymericola]